MAAGEGADPGLTPGYRLKPGVRLLPRALLLVGIPAIVTAALLLMPMPELDAFVADPSGTRITDSSGVFLSAVPGPGGSFLLRAGRSGIPVECARMFITLEDSRFRRHPGVDPLAALRAIMDRALSREARSGASTITMQLARLVEPRARSVAGKIVEAWLALRIESRLTKDEILTEYLDHVPFGRNTLGVGAAAWSYFATDLSQLTRAQLLVLAIIPRNPTVFDPFDSAPRLIAAARDLDARRHLGIDSAQIEAAVHRARAGRPSGDAPHFARYVQGELTAGRLRPFDGVLRTTLDLRLNHDIEGRVRFIL